MQKKLQKLELTWIGKDKRPRLEPRVLVEDAEKSHHAATRRRDGFTEYNIKRAIGLKTVRFNRGYVKNAPQMKWEVKKVVLMDGEDRECDPFNVPEGFLPTTIALHLGKRIG